MKKYDFKSINKSGRMVFALTLFGCSSPIR